ncbi:MAG: cytochrome c3 family protein [Ferruginibacter sp.]
MTTVYFLNVMFTTFKDDDVAAIKNREDKKFAGSATCVTCHKEIYESHIKTAHYLDSRPASKEFIKGSFKKGENKFIYNKGMEVVLQEKENRYFQTAYISGAEYQSEAFDIVIGSGRKGQTYLYWNNNSLFQLPVSYYTPLNNWCNSPGYSTSFINFNRTIPAQCVECHTTFAKVTEEDNTLPVYDKNNIIYGIDCERCHGPAADHVAFQSAHPEEKTAKYIISTKLLNRQQRLDACALCHSGSREPLKPAFSFNVGETLNDYSNAKYSSDSISTLDVHGNQYGLLASSKCFQMSQMDCSSCHNVHVNEANNAALFSQRCTTCHTQVNHTSFSFTEDKKEVVQNNCIDCHMPMLPSKKIVLDVANSDKVVPDVVRTHRISIYPEYTKQVLEKFNAKN